MTGTAHALREHILVIHYLFQFYTNKHRSNCYLHTASLPSYTGVLKLWCSGSHCTRDRQEIRGFSASLGFTVKGVACLGLTVQGVACPMQSLRSQVSFDGRYGTCPNHPPHHHVSKSFDHLGHQQLPQKHCTITSMILDQQLSKPNGT